MGEKRKGRYESIGKRQKSTTRIILYDLHVCLQTAEERLRGKERKKEQIHDDATINSVIKSLPYAKALSLTGKVK